MDISKFIIVVGSSSAGINVLPSLVEPLRNKIKSTFFIVSMVAYSRLKTRPGIIKAAWLYKLDTAGLIIPMGEISRQ
jgi:hypothetical protein